jgi:hypothetical protein
VKAAPKAWNGAKKGATSAWKFVWGTRKKPDGPKHAKPKNTKPKHAKPHPFGNGWIARAKAKDWPAAAREYLEKSLRENVDAWKAILTRHRDHPKTLERKIREAGGPVGTARQEITERWGKRLIVGSGATILTDVLRLLA